MVNNLRLKESSTSETSTDGSKAESSAELESSSSIEGMSESNLPEFGYKEDESLFLDDESECEDESNVSSRADEQFEEYPHRVIVDVDEMIRTYPKKDVSDFVTELILSPF